MVVETTAAAAELVDVRSVSPEGVMAVAALVAEAKEVPMEGDALEEAPVAVALWVAGVRAVVKTVVEQLVVEGRAEARAKPLDVEGGDRNPPLRFPVSWKNAAREGGGFSIHRRKSAGAGVLCITEPSL